MAIKKKKKAVRKKTTVKRGKTAAPTKHTTHTKAAFIRKAIRSPEPTNRLVCTPEGKRVNMLLMRYFRYTRAAFFNDDNNEAYEVLKRTHKEIKKIIKTQRKQKVGTLDTILGF